MRIAYILADNINPEGTSGASAHVRHVTGELQARGHEIEMIGHRVGAPLAEDVSQNGTKLTLKQSLAQVLPSFARRGLRNGRRRWRNRQLIAEHAEVIQRCDLVYERDAPQSFSVRRYVQKANLPWIIECNGIFWGEKDPFSNPIFPALYRKKHIRKWKQADHLIAVSHSFKSYISNKGVAPEKITVIHNGVDLDPHHQVAELDVKVFKQKHDLGKSTVIGFLGHMLPWHRIDLFLEAIAALRSRGWDVKGLLIGGGRWEEHKKTACELGISQHTVFTGPIPFAEVPTAVAAMNICTLPGSNEHGSPVKLFDYGAARKPVVGADFAAIREIVNDRENGLLFKKGSLKDFLDKLEVLVDAENVRTRLGEALYAKVKRDHTWQEVGGRTETIITSLCTSMTD